MANNLTKIIRHILQILKKRGDEPVWRLRGNFLFVAAYELAAYWGLRRTAVKRHASHSVTQSLRSDHPRPPPFADRECGGNVEVAYKGVDG